MDTFRTSSARTPREAPRVGDYRRGSRVRTTKAGTWFPATGPADEPAGLLLLHPAVKPAVLKTVIRRLAELRLAGVLPMLPGLVDQAGRNWLVATVAPTPTVADLLDDTAYGTPENAAAVLADIAATLLEVHAEGLAHGAVGAHAVVLGADGEPLLADWGLDEDAGVDGDTAAWAELAELLAQRWCADSPADAALLARAVNAAARPGPDGGLSAALAVLTQPDQGIAAQPVPSQPVPAQPAPSQPVPSQPVPSQPVPAQPAPAQAVPQTGPRHAAPAPPEPPPTEAPGDPTGRVEPPAPARAVPDPPTPPPPRLSPADLAPPSAQRYVSPPVESPATEPAPTPRSAPLPDPPRPASAPRPRPTPAPIPRPTPPATPGPAPTQRPAPPPESAPAQHADQPTAKPPGGLTTPQPRVPTRLPLPAVPEPTHDERDPLPPASAPDPRNPRRSRLGRARPALLTVLLTVILVAAVAVIIRPFDSNEPPPAEPAAPLEVRAVSVATQMKQSICVVAGTVTTNGQPGRLVYRWVGENGSQAVASVSTAGYNYQVEIGLLWSPSSPPLHGSSITLQILEPQPSTTSAELPIGCI